MFNKNLVPAAILAVSQMGMNHHVSAMEKQPKIKSEQLKEDFTLSAEEKERLFQKFKAMKQITKDQLPEDIQGEIGKQMLALAPKNIFKFRCPTPDELREKLKQQQGEANGNNFLRFSIVGNLKFFVDRADLIPNLNEFSYATALALHPTKRQENSNYIQGSKIECKYDSNTYKMVVLRTEIPLDKYILTIDQPDENGILFSEDNIYHRFYNNPEFTLTKRETPK